MSSRARIALVLLVAAVGGAGTMTVELAAVRLLAPWFGTSLVVWTNVIAVVLLALALGYVIGGRLSNAGRPLVRLGTTLLLAAAVTAWLPAFSGPVADLFLPQGLALHEAADVVLWGSLAAALLLFLPSALLLGTVAPLAVEAVAELEKRSAGHAGGFVLGASTLGSLVGVFGTSHAFLPTLGLKGTFLFAAGCLAAAGGLGLFLARGASPRGKAALGLALLAWGGALLAGEAARPALGPGQRELAHAESSYQSIRVVEEERDGVHLRYLQVNEGFDSYQSVWQPEPGLLPTGFYYNDFVLPAWWSAAEGDWNVLVLGLGAGTVVRVLEGAMPPGLRLLTTGVELDPVVVTLARQHLALTPGPERRVHDELDARVALRALDGGFQQIVLDCYANQVEIPPHLCTREFFTEVRERLAEGGWLSANLGGFGFDDPVVAAVARSCAEAFEMPVLLLRVPQARNFVLFVRRGSMLPVEYFHEKFTDLATVAGPASALLEMRRLPGGWRLVRPGGPGTLLTDDHNPIERLQLESIAEGRARLLASGGTG